MPQDAPFVYFNEWNEVSTYHCSLPHWRQEQVLYFVTFRLGDSIPQLVLDGWKEERRVWLAARGLKSESALSTLPREERYQYARHFNRQVHIALDRGQGACWLQREDIGQIVAGTFLASDKLEYLLGDFIVMPNHVHVLVAPAPDQRLEYVLKRWKGRSARLANQLLGRRGKFWQRESYDRIVRDQKELAAFRNYIFTNPQKSKLRKGRYVLGSGSLSEDITYSEAQQFGE